MIIWMLSLWIGHQEPVTFPFQTLEACEMVGRGFSMDYYEKTGKAMMWACNKVEES